MKQCHLTAVIWKGGKRYVSKCPELGVASFGATPEKARAALGEAVELFISSAKRLKLLDDVEPALASTQIIRALRAEGFIEAPDRERKSPRLRQD